MNERTGAVVLTTPSNPTGRIAPPDEVRAIVDAATQYDAYVIAEEVYSRLVYGDYQTGVAGYVDHSEQVLIVGSCSKTYAMTGWRVGWLLGPDDVVHAAMTFRESTTACTSSIAQHSALEALTGQEGEMRSMHAAFQERCDYVIDRVSDIDRVPCPTPEGAFYAFLDGSELDDSSLKMAMELLYDYGVLTAPGGGFGEAGAGSLRVSFANSMDRLEAGFDRIAAFASEHR